MQDNIHERLKAILDGHIQRGGVGISMAYKIGDGEAASLTAGVADRDRQTPISAGRLFKIGSCTKTFVAAALMKLAANQRVDLDQKIATWFPDLPRAGEIALRQLINHRNGLPEFEYDIPMTADRLWSPLELTSIAFKVGQQNPPGGAVVYNNTGYVLAGLVIEAVSGQTLGAFVRDAILTPLGLAHSWSPATEAFPTADMVKGYYCRPMPADGVAKAFSQGGEMWNMDGILPYSDELQESSGLFPFTAAYACGDMVSTPSDMVGFLDGLFSGRLLPQPFLEAMSEGRSPAAFPGTRLRESGAGIFLSDYAGGHTLGHQGSIPGYVTVMQYDRERRLAIAVATNSGSGYRTSFHASGIHAVVDDLMQVLKT